MYIYFTNPFCCIDIIFSNVRNNNADTNTQHKCRRTLLFRYESIYQLLDFGSSTQGERQFLKVFANPRISDPNARCILWCLRSLSVEVRKTPTTSSTRWTNPQLSTQWQRTQFSAYMVQSQISTASFLKSSNSQDHLFWAWHHLHSSLISCLGFIMTMVIVIPFARERKIVPNDCAPEVRTE